MMTATINLVALKEKGVIAVIIVVISTIITNT